MQAMRKLKPRESKLSITNKTEPALEPTTAQQTRCRKSRINWESQPCTRTHWKPIQPITRTSRCLINKRVIRGKTIVQGAFPELEHRQTCKLITEVLKMSSDM